MAGWAEGPSPVRSDALPRVAAVARHGGVSRKKRVTGGRAAEGGPEPGPRHRPRRNNGRQNQNQTEGLRSLGRRSDGVRHCADGPEDRRDGAWSHPAADPSGALDRAPLASLRCYSQRKRRRNGHRALGPTRPARPLHRRPSLRGSRSSSVSAAYLPCPSLPVPERGRDGSGAALQPPGSPGRSGVLPFMSCEVWDAWLAASGASMRGLLVGLSSERATARLNNPPDKWRASPEPRVTQHAPSSTR